MASPVGHTLLGVLTVLATKTVILLLSSQKKRVQPRLERYQQIAFNIFDEVKKHYVFWLWIIFMANAPDFDLIVGLFYGDMNLFHHGVSHSVGMAFVIVFVTGSVLSFFNGIHLKDMIYGMMAYFSHLLGDYLTEDGSFPYGAPFLWPLSDQYYLSPRYVFLRIEHGDPGDSITLVMEKLLSAHNMLAMVTEMMLLIPILLLIYYRKDVFRS